MPFDFENLIKQLEAAAASSREANEKRYQQAMAIYDEIIERYQPGGTFEAAHEQLLQTAKKREVAGGMQAAVSGGLFGTTRTAGLGRAWEEQVGAPSRLQRSDILMQRLSQAQLGQAGLIERREDIGPSFRDIFEMARAGGEGGKDKDFSSRMNRRGKKTTPGDYARRAEEERQRKIQEWERMKAEREARRRGGEEPSEEKEKIDGGVSDEAAYTEWVHSAISPKIDKHHYYNIGWWKTNVKGK